MLSLRNFFDQPMNNIKTYEHIRKNATGQGDDYTTGCLLDYLYFKENYKMIAIDLSKQQALDADPRAIQLEISILLEFQIKQKTRILDQAEDAFMFLILDEGKETILDFSQGTVRVL